MAGKSLRAYCVLPLVLFVFAAASLSCLSSSVIWVTKAEETVFAQLTPGDTALVRSIFCDVSLEPVNEKKLKKLLSFKFYSNGNPLLKSYSIPPFEFMHFVVKNTGKHPLTIEEAYVEAGNRVMQSLTCDDIAKKYPYKRYEIFNFKNLFAMRRLIAEKQNILGIDYSRQTIDVRFNFIAPGDRVVFMRTFDWVPLSFDTFTVVLVVKSAGFARKISFNLKRECYRKGGSLFREQDKRGYDDIL